jgi:hypothetical protein
MGLYDQYNDEALINRLHQEPPNVARAMEAELRQRQWNRSNDSFSGMNVEIKSVHENVTEIKKDQKRIHKVHFWILVFAIIGAAPVLLEWIRWFLKNFLKI